MKCGKSAFRWQVHKPVNKRNTIKVRIQQKQEKGGGALKWTEPQVLVVKVISTSYLYPFTFTELTGARTPAMRTLVEGERSTSMQLAQPFQAA